MMFKAKRVATEGTYFKQCKERVKLVLLEVVIRVGDFFFLIGVYDVLYDYFWSV